MISRRLPATLLTGISFLVSASSIFASANHLVISEIQTRSVASADDEFVELYNPTNTSISIDGLRLRLNVSSNLVDSLSGSIPAHGFYLVAKPGSDLGGVVPDATYTASSSAITSNSTISLLDTDHTTIIDRVGMGTATLYETTPITAPVSGGSIERKVSSASTLLSMSLGGVDYLLGNGEDTDNNSSDFIQRDFSQPQNSLSALEPVLITPTPTSTPSPTPTSTPEPTSIPTPTATPTPTIIPTSTPTPSPTSTSTPIPTPTSTTTPTPLPTNSPEPTFTPTVTPTPTASEDRPNYFNWHRRPVCTIVYVPKHFFHRKIYVPQLSCHFTNRWGDWSDWDN